MSETPLHLVRSNRAIPAPVERAINAALSRGPGYEPTPIGPAFDDTSVSGYYIDFRAKTTSPDAGDAAALPAVQLIQLALGWWERHVAGDGAALGRFLHLRGVIQRRAEPRAGFPALAGERGRAEVRAGAGMVVRSGAGPGR